VAQRDGAIALRGSGPDVVRVVGGRVVVALFDALPAGAVERKDQVGVAMCAWLAGVSAGVSLKSSRKKSPGRPASAPRPWTKPEVEQKES